MKNGDSLSWEAERLKCRNLAREENVLMLFLVPYDIIQFFNAFLSKL